MFGNIGQLVSLKGRPRSVVGKEVAGCRRSMTGEVGVTAGEPVVLLMKARGPDHRGRPAREHGGHRDEGAVGILGLNIASCSSQGTAFRQLLRRVSSRHLRYHVDRAIAQRQCAAKRTPCKARAGLSQNGYGARNR